MKKAIYTSRDSGKLYFNYLDHGPIMPVMRGKHGYRGLPWGLMEFLLIANALVWGFYFFFSP